MGMTMGMVMVMTLRVLAMTLVTKMTASVKVLGECEGEGGG